MDGSDREIKDDCWTEEKLKRGEKHNETEEICQDKESMHYTPVNTSVKQKSEQCSENHRKRSTDNVRKDHDEHLIGCANMQDTDFAVSNSKKYEKQLNAKILPCSKTKSMEGHSDQVDPSNTEEKIEYSKKSHSATQEIKESIIRYFSDVIDQSETDRLHLETIIDEINNGVIKILKRIKEKVISNRNVTSDKPTSENILDSKKFKICISIEDDTKVIDENSLEKEQLERTSTLAVIESMCPKCKQDKFLTPIISPGKKKSEDIDEETKRKQIADIALLERNDKSLTDTLNAEDSAVYAGYSKKSEKHSINTAISIDAEGLVQKEDIAINRTDKPTIQYKITETTGEIAYDTHELETSNKTSTSDETQNSDKVLLLDNSNGSFTRNISAVEQSLLSAFSGDMKGSINLQNEINNESTSVNRLEDSKNKDIATENLSNFQDFPDMSVPDLPSEAENKLVKFSNKISNTDIKVSYDIPLQMGENSAKTSKSEDTNISKKHENESFEESLTRQGIISISGMTNSNYNEEDSKIINLENLEKDTEFIERQKQILDSISQRRRQTWSINSESDVERKIRKPLIKSGPKEVHHEIPTEVAVRIDRLIEILYITLKTQGIEDIAEPTVLVTLLKDLAENYDPDCIPYISDFIKKRTETAMKTAIAKSIEQFLEENPSVEESTEELPDIPTPMSPNSSPLKNESEIVERDSLGFREYPGLAEDLTSVKKDARYQKKFYKGKNPVMLPINWSGDKASCEIQPNIDSDENKINSTDGLGIVTRNSEDSVHDKKSSENRQNTLKYTYLLKEKEKSEDRLSPEEQTKVKEQRYQKKFCRSKLLPLRINWSTDRDSSSEIEPNIDSDKNVIQRIGDDQRITSRNSDDSIHESEYSKVLLKDKNMFKGKQSPEEKPLRTSDSTSEYRISSFMEESPNSSQSNSPKNELKFPSVLGINPQPEELSARSMPNSSEILSTLAGPPQSPSTLAGPPQSASTLAGPPHTNA